MAAVALLIVVCNARRKIYILLISDDLLASFHYYIEKVHAQPAAEPTTAKKAIAKPAAAIVSGRKILSKMMEVSISFGFFLLCV